MTWQPTDNQRVVETLYLINYMWNGKKKMFFKWRLESGTFSANKPKCSPQRFISSWRHISTVYLMCVCVLVCDLSYNICRSCELSLLLSFIIYLLSAWTFCLFLSPFVYFWFQPPTCVFSVLVLGRSSWALFCLFSVSALRDIGQRGWGVGGV